jgi:hypothetical protein
LAADGVLRDALATDAWLVADGLDASRSLESSRYDYDDSVRWYAPSGRAICCLYGSFLL